MIARNIVRSAITATRAQPFSSSARALVIQRKPAATSMADLHELPKAAKAAVKSSPAPATINPESGNSTAPEDLSSRPAAPGPSGPVIDAEVAAPETVSRTGNGNGNDPENWTTSFAGMSTQPFEGKAAEVLQEPLDPEDVEIKPDSKPGAAMRKAMRGHDVRKQGYNARAADGLIYLPEIKYRRILTRAFGPGGWAMAPRSETNVGAKVVSREWVLVCHGRYVAMARGEQEYFDPNGIATASEAAKSNALMRCCKDLSIASELWDPRFIRDFKKKHCLDVWVEDAKSGKKRRLWRRKDQPPFEFPFKEVK